MTLQRSLLPRRLPEVAGLDLAVRYVPASAQTEVGGDFYELMMLDGHLLVAIGDVAGHSLHAATVMAELRHAVRAYAVEGHPPGAILERANDADAAACCRPSWRRSACCCSTRRPARSGWPAPVTCRRCWSGPARCSRSSECVPLLGVPGRTRRTS